MTKPDVAKAVKIAMEDLIADVQNVNRSLEGKPVDRRIAASVVLRKKPGWYWQTPEGEYLLWVCDGEK